MNPLLIVITALLAVNIGLLCYAAHRRAKGPAACGRSRLSAGLAGKT